MKVLGIIRSNGLELVDAEIRDGALFPQNCPAGLSIACNDCDFSVSTGAARDIAGDAVTEQKKRNNVLLLVCRWHETDRPAPRTP